MNRPTVLIVAPSAYHFGGLATWLDYLDPGLCERGWRVVLGLVDGPRYHRPDDYLRYHPHRDVVRIRCETGTHQGRIRAVAQAIRRLKPDILLGVNIPHVVPAIDQCRKIVPTRLALTIHGFQVDLFRDLRQFQSSCDAVIAANQLGCRLAVEYAGFETERVFHAPCGTAVPATLPARQISTSEPSAADRPLQIAWVGRLEESTKRLSDLPLILQALDRRGMPYHLTIVGTGPDETYCREQLQPWLQHGAVTMTGYVDPTELPARVYQNSDAVLITSPCEAGPIVAWEAMAHGAVVVSSRYLGSGAEGVLNHGKTALLFDVGDAEAAAELLAELRQSPELQHHLRVAGFEAVVWRYSHEASVQAWDRALRTVLYEIPPRQPVAPSQFSRFSSRSRLDAWCGPTLGDALRRCTGRIPSPQDAGSEWPHAVSQSQGDDPEFWKLARDLDTRGESAAVRLASGTRDVQPARIPTFRQRVGCWLHERWRLEFALRCPVAANRFGMGWLDQCNRSESLGRESKTGGRICHWQNSSHLTAARISPQSGGRLLQVAAAEWPFGFDDSTTPRTSDTPEISVLIAISGRERWPQLRMTLASLRAQQNVSFEIIVVELGAQPCLQADLPRDVRYIHAASELTVQPFNKSWALNIGARAARGKFLALHDGDLLVPQNYLAQCVTMLQAFDGVRPHRFLFYLDKEPSHVIDAQRSVKVVREVDKVVANTPMPIVVRTEAYWSIGGHDESFFGWGGEDEEFLSRLRTRRFSEGGLMPVIHVWHPASPKKANGDRNRATYDGIVRVPPIDRIRRLAALKLGGTHPQPISFTRAG